MSAGATTTVLGATAFVPGRQVSQLTVIDTRTRQQQVLLETTAHIEAPNWSPDGDWLLYNSEGRLFKLRADGTGAPAEVPTELPAWANNDHVISPDGATIYASVNDGHIYAIPWAGGAARRVSNLHPSGTLWLYYLHGISPDGLTLLYVGLTGAADSPRYGLYSLPSAGGPDVLLWDGGVPADGPEFSPDGQWIYFNAEAPERDAGHAQLYRMRADGSGVEQLSHDERVNWFPHPSPDGSQLASLSYPPGTLGHPANREVVLHCRPAAGGAATELVSLLGGQGTVNVNSWAPDSRWLAYVAYPECAPQSGA
ncbi:MAG: hypothetical protein RJA98_1328 [Pseudomonadota bacterium]|jgi:Tol biopolymer transport system component